MRNFSKIILALAILAVCTLLIRWLVTDYIAGAKNVAATTPSGTRPNLAPVDQTTVAAPATAATPAGDKNKPSANSATSASPAEPTQHAFGAKFEADFGEIELEDGVPTRLTMNTGGTCEIRPTVLANGNLQLVVVLVFIDTDTGEIQPATPSIITPPGQPVWFGVGGKGDAANSPARFGVSFTPKLKIR